MMIPTMSPRFDQAHDDCWDCGHLLGQHSRSYRGWDSRSPGHQPVKQHRTGCLVPGCPCRRWFEPTLRD